MRWDIENQVSDLANQGAIFYVSHSGGKDSQAMLIEICRVVPPEQIVVIHAHLPEVEWKGTRAHIKETIGALQFLEVTARKTFFEMVDHRQMFPGPKYRQCTSDLKRGPIEKAIRADLKAKQKTLAVNCMGLRAEESKPRAKQPIFKLHKNLSKAGRTVYNLLPIHDFLVGKVFKTIRDAGQQPHWAYKAGMSRLSCCFCIMASDDDLTVAAKQNPELYRRFVMKERELNFTLKQGKTLEDITGILIDKKILAA